MGMLDFKKRVEWKPPTKEDYDKSPAKLLCGKCGREFTGQAWMMTSKRDIECKPCYEETKSFFDGLR